MDYCEAIVVILLGVFLGWIIAHGSVANECNKLGSFYVGDVVYDCKVKPKN